MQKALIHTEGHQDALHLEEHRMQTLYMNASNVHLVHEATVHMSSCLRKEL